jgi:MraZ protein
VDQSRPGRRIGAPLCRADLRDWWGKGLDRFLSQFRNRFDAKGRISLPATFRAVLARTGGEGVFLHPSLDAPALDGGGQGLIDEIQAMLDALAPYSREREDLATALLSTGEMLKLDSEGRMVLPERLREAAELKDEAVFVGQGRKFQIWEPARFAAHLDEARARARILRGRLSEARP